MTLPNSDSSRPVVDRRRFLERSARGAAVGVAAGLTSWLPAHAGSPETVRLGVIGMRSRGRELAERFQAIPGTNVLVVCDVAASA